MKKFTTTYCLVFIFINLSSVGLLHAAMQSSGTSVSVRDFGASGKKSQDATAFIQEAIDVVADKGGGTVILPPGEYTSGTIFLRDNINLHLYAGATLFATTDTAAYEGKGKIKDTGSLDTPVLIYGKGLKNIAITGRGIIKGEPEFLSKPFAPYEFIQREYDIAKAAGIELVTPTRVEPSASLIYLTECTDILIEDVSLVDSPFWGLHLHWSERIRIRGIKITSDLNLGVNSDGLDIDGCKDVVVSDCIISTADDAIVLKTTDRNGEHRSCENVTITNCILESTSSALKLGTESYGDFNHIIFDNCVIRNTNRGLGIFIRDGGTASNIIFSNITMECNRKDFHWWGDGDALRFVVLKRNEDSKIGGIENVLVKDVIAHVQGSSVIEGFEGKNLKNIKLSNVQFHMNRETTPDKRAVHGLQVKGVDNLTLKDVRVDWSTATEKNWESAVNIEAVNGLFIDNFVGRQGIATSNHPALHMKNVQNARVFNCLALPETKNFLKISGSETANIYLSNNVLHEASKPVIKAKEVSEQEVVYLDE